MNEKNGYEFPCDMCKETFSHRSLLNVHKMSHYITKVPAEPQMNGHSFRCDVCLDLFTSLEFLNVHKRRHIQLIHSEESISMSGSDIEDEMQKENTLQRASSPHVLTNPLVRKQAPLTVKDVYGNEDENEDSFDEDSFDDEISLPTDDEAGSGDKSHLKDVEIENLDDLNKVEDLKPQDRDEYPVKCNVCGKSFRFPSRLKFHMKCHNENVTIAKKNALKCIICDISFTTTSHRNVHEKTHYAEPEFRCDICEKKFTQKSILKRHKATHFASSKHTCKICDKVFKQKRYLICHMKTHELRMAFKCDICESMLATKSNLRKHLKKHVNHKQYTCNVCDKKFVSFNHYCEHKRQHKEEKTFECRTCQKKFRKNCHLVQHQSVHTRRYQYQCEICKYSYRSQSSLKRHVRRVHKNIKASETGEDPVVVKRKHIVAMYARLISNRFVSGKIA